jgi:hypothetical protein
MNERNKKQCIVLLPSGPHFERLFEEVLELAIRKAGLLPSRLRWDSSPIPIHIFVDEIEQAEAVVADISEHTDEIWLAVGCAIALGKPLCLISSARESDLPLGIQYLPNISYPVDAFPTDYMELQQNILAQLSAILPPSHAVQLEPQLQVAAPPPPPPPPPSPPTPAVSDDLVSYEVMALTIIDHKASAAGLSPRELGLEMQACNAAPLTSHAMNALKRRRFIESKSVQIGEGNEFHLSENLFLTRTGEEWLIRHGKRTATRRSAPRARARFSQH